MQQGYPVLPLKSGREYSLLNGHPWLFSGAFREIPQDLAAGAVVDVANSRGEWVARGHLNGRNSLAFRALSFDANERIDRDFYRRRIRYAFALRRLIETIRIRSGLCMPKPTDCPAS